MEKLLLNWTNYILYPSQLLYFSSVPSQNFCQVYVILNEKSSIDDLAGKGQPFLTSQSYLNLGGHMILQL